MFITEDMAHLAMNHYELNADCCDEVEGRKRFCTRLDCTGGLLDGGRPTAVAELVGLQELSRL